MDRPAAISKVLLAECRMVLPRPIRLGSVLIRTRDYVAMRLVAADGSYGDAIGYTRGTPLLEIARGLAADIIGTLSGERDATLENVLAMRVNARSSFIRAASLYDIAMSDLAAKAAGRSWGEMQGGTRQNIPLMAVAGYYLDDRGIDDVVREVAALLDVGHARVKIMLRGDDVDFDRRYVEACAKVADGRLAVDAHWSFTDLAIAAEYLRVLDGCGLAFIEDPFGAHLHRYLAPLQKDLATPLAAGEDMPDEFSLADLAGSIPILRVDATTCGGLSPAARVIRTALMQGRRILPHIFTPLHAQLAVASPDIEMVEIIPEATGADPLMPLLQRKPKIVSGALVADREPGAGMSLDWAAVESAAAQTAVEE